MARQRTQSRNELTPSASLTWRKVTLALRIFTQASCLLPDAVSAFVARDICIALTNNQSSRSDPTTSPHNFTTDPMGLSLYEKPVVVQQVEKSPALYLDRKFIAVFSYWSLSWATLIQFKATHRISLWYNLILSSHLFLGLPSDSFSSGFPATPIYSLILPTVRTTRHAHFILIDAISLLK